MLKTFYTSLLFFVFLLVIVIPPDIHAEKGQKKDEGLFYYHQGVAAKTIGEREKAFEKSLQIYLAMYNKMEKEKKMNGLLCYNIGNCYFNLKQLGEAIFYYKTGLKLLPENEKIKENLQIALKKRENPIDIESSKIKETLLFFHYKFSISQRIDILIVLSIITSILLTGLIYKNNIALKYLSAIFSFIVICFFLSLAIEYYAPLHYGIIIQKTDIRKDAGEGFAPITSKSLTEGSSIKVVSLEKDWYKVKLNDGRKGFINKKHLKIVI